MMSEDEIVTNFVTGTLLHIVGELYEHLFSALKSTILLIKPSPTFHEINLINLKLTGGLGMLEPSTQ